MPRGTLITICVCLGAGAALLLYVVFVVWMPNRGY